MFPSIMDVLQTIFEDALLEEYEETMDVSEPAPNKPVPASTTITPTTAASTWSLEASEPCAPITPQVPDVPDISATTVVSVMKESCAVTAPQTPEVSKGPTAPKKPSGSNRNSNSTHKCAHCHKNHPVYRCASFRKMPLEKKLRLVVLRRLCSRCLSPKHLAKSCPSTHKCRLCNELHHNLLHPQTKVIPTESTRQKVSRPAFNRLPAPVPNVAIQRVVTFSPTLKVFLNIGSKRIPVRAAMDLCCNMSYICTTLVQQLKIPVATVNGTNVAFITIGSIHRPYPELKISAKIKKMVGIKTPAESVSDTIREQFAGLELADPTFNVSGQVALVLGPELSAKLLKGTTYSSLGSLIAQYTLFGWVVSGQSLH